MFAAVPLLAQCAPHGQSGIRVLLVGDNDALGPWLRRALAGPYTVDLLADGGPADLLLRGETCDLVIPDLGLPGLDGTDVLRNLRARGMATPVRVLTANNSLRSRVSGLDHGADDDMAKPFELEKLEARIRLLLRRSAGRVNPLVACGDLVYGSNTREFTQAGTTLALTPRERAALEVLILKACSTVTKAALAQSLLSIDATVSPDEIEIDVHRLRKTLEGGSAASVTLRGLGYLLPDMPRG